MAKRYSCSMTRSGRIFARRSVAIRKSQLIALEEQDEHDEEVTRSFSNKFISGEGTSHLEDLDEGCEEDDEEFDSIAGTADSYKDHTWGGEEHVETCDLTVPLSMPCASRTALDEKGQERLEDHTTRNNLGSDSMRSSILPTMTEPNKSDSAITVIQATPDIPKEGVKLIRRPEPTEVFIEQSDEIGNTSTTSNLFRDTEKNKESIGSRGTDEFYDDLNSNGTDMFKKNRRRAQNVNRVDESIPEGEREKTSEVVDDALANKDLSKSVSKIQSSVTLYSSAVSGDLITDGSLNSSSLVEEGKENEIETESPVAVSAQVQRTKRRCSVFPVQLVKKNRLREGKLNEHNQGLERIIDVKELITGIASRETTDQPNDFDGEGSGRVHIRYNGKRCKKNRVFVVTELHPSLQVSPPTKSCFRKETPESGSSKAFRWADSKDDQPLCEQKEFEEEGFSHNFRKTTKRQVLYSDNL